MADPAERPFLDRPAARGIALLVLLGCIALLGWLHRDDLIPGDPGQQASPADPAAPCIAERSADIQRMVDEGLIEAAQAELFRERAIGMCRDTMGGGSAPSPAPGLPPPGLPPR